MQVITYLPKYAYFYIFMYLIIYFANMNAILLWKVFFPLMYKSDIIEILINLFISLKVKQKSQC